MPVDGTRFAQAIIVPEKDDPLDPRFVPRKQVERFKAAGHTPVAAVELEYYVTGCRVLTDSSPSMHRAGCRARPRSR